MSPNFNFISKKSFNLRQPKTQKLKDLLSQRIWEGKLECSHLTTGSGGNSGKPFTFAVVLKEQLYIIPNIVTLSSISSLVVQLVKNPPAMRETGFDPCIGKIPWRRERLLSPVFWPGEFHGLYSSWGCRELNMTERLSLSLFISLKTDYRKYRNL